YSLVGNGIDRPRGQTVVVERRAAGRHAEGGRSGADRTRAGGRRARRAGGRVLGVVDADVGALAGEGRRHVVDVATAVVVVDHPSQGDGVGNQRDVQDRSQVGIRIAVRGDSVSGLDARLDLIELRLVGDVADHTRLGARAEERPLRAFQHLDAIQVSGVDIEVAVGELAGLVVEVDGDVGPRPRRATPLAGLRPGAQAAHEDLVLARAVARGRDAWQEFDVVVEGRDVELLQGLSGEGLHRDRHVLDALLALLSRDDDLLERASLGCAGRRLGGGRADGRASQDGRYRI